MTLVKIAIIIAIPLLVITAIAQGQSSTLFTGTGDVMVGEPAIPVTVWLDEDLTLSYVNPWHWGVVPAGSAELKYLYVVNEGMEPLLVTGMITTKYGYNPDGPVKMGIMASNSPLEPILINPGECEEFQVGCSVREYAEIGSIEPFGVSFVEVGTVK